MSVCPFGLGGMGFMVSSPPIMVAKDSWMEALFGSGQERLVALAARYAVPMIFLSAASTKIGGLMGYSAARLDDLRQAGRYAGRILKGEKPADLPVLLPTKFEFAINLKTAKSLRLEISPFLIALADVE